jgi:TPR repeat protein
MVQDNAAVAPHNRLCLATTQNWLLASRNLALWTALALYGLPLPAVWPWLQTMKLTLKHALAVTFLALSFASATAQDCTDGAAKWVLEGAAKGDPTSQLILGAKCDEKDDAAAAIWYRKAADQGEPRAQWFLGSMYEEGRGVPQDYVLAYMWFNLAAAKGAIGARTDRDTVAAKMTPAQLTDNRSAEARP